MPNPTYTGMVFGNHQQLDNHHLDQYNDAFFANCNGGNNYLMIKSIKQSINSESKYSTSVVHTEKQIDLKLANGSSSIINNCGLSSIKPSRGLRILICTESFHPYTSGIARRFKEIIRRLADRGFLIHIITGCRGCETWTDNKYYQDKVTFSRLTSIEFKDKIDCSLPFLIPTVRKIFFLLFSEKISISYLFL